MVAQMDMANRALCYALRNPPKGTKKTKYSDIVKVVRKKDGHRPTESSVAEAAANFNAAKEKRGRPEGARSTTKAEDRTLLKTFKKKRPVRSGRTMTGMIS